MVDLCTCTRVLLGGHCGQGLEPVALTQTTVHPVQTLVVMIGQNPLWIGMEVKNKECVRGIVMIGLAINTPGSPCPRITVPSNSGTSYRGSERWGCRYWVNFRENLKNYVMNLGLRFKAGMSAGLVLALLWCIDSCVCFCT